MEEDELLGESYENISMCYGGANRTTIAHELMHSLGLNHTFSNFRLHSDTNNNKNLLDFFLKNKKMRFLCLFLFFNIAYSQQNVRYAKIDLIDNPPYCWGLLNHSFARYVINIKALDNDIYMLIDTKNDRRREPECSIPKHSIDNGYFLTINKQQVRFDKTEELALDHCIPLAIYCSKKKKDTYVAIEMVVACYMKDCATCSYIFVHLYDNKVKEVKAIGELDNELTDKKIKSYMSNNGFKFLK